MVKDPFYVFFAKLPITISILVYHATSTTLMQEPPVHLIAAFAVAVADWLIVRVTLRRIG